MINRQPFIYISFNGDVIWMVGAVCKIALKVEIYLRNKETQQTKIKFLRVKMTVWWNLFWKFLIECL